MNKDKAGRDYWDRTWENKCLPAAINPYSRDISNYIYRKYHMLFSKLFSNMDTKKASLLEIGCARSTWLPYFTKEFAFDVSGIDYSEIGCRQAEELLQREGMKGQIICSDVFDPPEFLLEKFDVVISFGVIEHFENTQNCILEFSKFLKPGGMLITVIPNMRGLVGIMQKVLNRPVYNIHNPLNLAQLVFAHKKAEIDVILCKYFLSTCFGVINIESEDHNFFSIVKTELYIWLSRLSKLIWLIEIYFGSIIETSIASPYIICVAKKRGLLQGE